MKGYVHCDIKPDNFMMGLGEAEKKIIYISDFGLSTRYIQEGVHIPKRSEQLGGTLNYMSTRAHKYTQSRRDDLESIGYVLLRFLKGKLPWENTSAACDRKLHKSLANQKLQANIPELLLSQPPVFCEYLTYCRKLKFTQDPDYGKLIIMFQEYLRSRKLDPEAPEFVWEAETKKKGKAFKEIEQHECLGCLIF